MASIPWPSKAPKVWDTLILGGVTMPGVARLRVRGGQKIDRKDAPGADGETTVQQGEKAKDVDITLRIHKEEQWDTMVDGAFATLEPVVGKRVPLDVVHPTAAARKIRSITIEEIAGPDWNEQERVMEYSIKALEHKPPPKKNATKKNATSQAGAGAAGANDADVQFGRINVATSREAASTGFSLARLFGG